MYALALNKDNSRENIKKEYEYFDRLHGQKYRDKDQTRKDHEGKLADNLASTELHAHELFEAIHYKRFIPAGRIQAALGAVEREVSPFNCSVSQKVEDSIDGIYHALWRAAKILRLGTGIGYNFSHLRPHGSLVRALQTEATGPLSYMKLFNQSAALIASAGHRRGAQMGILNVDHPDIEAFIDSKMEKGALHSFNISVGVTDDFMRCVREDESWQLRFRGETYKSVSARYLWEKILRNAYESAEPGVVFLDTMNNTNNLWYCEEIEATNPCSEQPLPPYGLCTLGSFNLMGYMYWDGTWNFNQPQFEADIYAVVEGYDNIFDNAIYAIEEHKTEALAKRRIGLGLTGIANAIELMHGVPCYGDVQFNRTLEIICANLAHTAYRASIDLAIKRGPFPLFDPGKYLQGKFIQTLPEDIQRNIDKHGIRNSHLISYAPCGTISQVAGNVSSGVEPIFYHEVNRDVFMKEGKENITLKDFAYREYGFKGRTLEECTVENHLAVGGICQKYCDSAVSKTVNVAESCTYEDYVKIYERAYDMGMKGITVFRPTELRGAVITKAEIKDEPNNTSEFNTSSCASGVCER